MRVFLQVAGQEGQGGWPAGLQGRHVSKHSYKDTKRTPIRLQVPKLLGLLTNTWVPHSMVVSFKLETDPDMLIRKVTQAWACVLPRLAAVAGAPLFLLSFFCNQAQQQELLAGHGFTLCLLHTLNP